MNSGVTTQQQGIELTAYRLRKDSGIKLVAAQSGRTWMEETNHRFAYRCLPMRIATQAGWVLLNDRPVRAKWLGTATENAVVIEQTGDPPYAAFSHFGEGILTFALPFLFRTSPGTALLIRGPANAPKDGIAPLEGLVETDWAIARSSMNWKFTRANVWVEFEVGEPFCMIVPQQLATLEAIHPRIIDIQESPDTQHKLQIWTESYRNFNNRLRQNDPEALKVGWQQYYFRGTAPHDISEPAEGHRTRLKIREFLEPVRDNP